MIKSKSKVMALPPLNPLQSGCGGGWAGGGGGEGWGGWVGGGVGVGVGVDSLTRDVGADFGGSGV
jgi:hypothetical protein